MLEENMTKGLMDALAREEETFIGSYLREHGLKDLDDIVLVRQHIDDGSVRLSIDRKRPEEKEVYIRELEEEVALLRRELRAFEEIKDIMWRERWRSREEGVEEDG
jgi:hypothetical protein